MCQGLRVAGGVLGLALLGMTLATGSETPDMPPSWHVLPIPLYVDYGTPEDAFDLGRVAIVRQEAGPYHTRRDAQGELCEGSTITQEELIQELVAQGAEAVDCVPDDRPSYEAYRTLILLGAPARNRQAAKWCRAWGWSFDRWQDSLAPGVRVAEWRDLGPEGYVLKAVRAGGQNVVLLAGYDVEDVRGKFGGAGTFYAFQSLRQLLFHRQGQLAMKTAEILDKPLVAVRGCFSGFEASEEQEWRNAAFIPRLKANQVIYWYGNNLAGYNAEAASRFRYPWRAEQLALLRRVGRFYREHFVTMVFCMNADHFGVAWAAPKTFDGRERDPLHYDLNHAVEPEFKEMWAKLGYEVHQDVDILAAKFAQLQEAVPGSMLQMMNEDDVFGLVHDADQLKYGAATGNAKQNAAAYGRARGAVLAALYRKIMADCPGNAGYLPVCPPGQLCYQTVLENNQDHSRDFMAALGQTLREEGVADRVPVLTTGGGTAAEVVTSAEIQAFRSWCGGAPVVICDNNFPAGFHVGAYETDPQGPRSPHQLDPTYPAGYRDRDLYQHVWGIAWNGLNDQHVLGWCQSQYMWNMRALRREEINALARRKVSSATSYPLVTALYQEFDNPACYLPDNQPPERLKAVSDTIVFPSQAWSYRIDYSAPRRRECERLRDKLAWLIPQLEQHWEHEFEKRESVRSYGWEPYAFCTVYLAYGYLKGWAEEDGEGLREGGALRDLYLDALEIQERFFAGPERLAGKPELTHHFYTGCLRYIYVKGLFGKPLNSRDDATDYVDIWDEGLRERFYQPLRRVVPADIPDQDVQLAGAWGPADGTGDERFRTVMGNASLRLETPVAGATLVRIRLGTETESLTDSCPVTLSVGPVTVADAVCKPRWILLRIPDDALLTEVSVHCEKPVRVLAVEFCGPA